MGGIVGAIGGAIVGGIFGSGGGSSKAAKIPDPRDAAADQGKYLFGGDFQNYRGVTDPRLQNRILESEAEFRPRYTALELEDMGTMLRGVGPDEVNPMYERNRREREAFRKIEEKIAAKEDTGAFALNIEDFTPGERYYLDQRGFLKDGALKLDDDTGEVILNLRRAGEQAARSTREFSETGEYLDETTGLFGLLKEEAERSGELQRSELDKQRADDVSALEKYSGQAVEAYRDADPYSTGLAEKQTAMADDLYQRAQGLNPEQQRLVDQQALGMAQRQGRVTDQSAIAGQLMGRENYLSGLRSEAAGMGLQAFNQNRNLSGDIGNTILGRSSNSIGLAQDTMGRAQRGAEGQMGPQLFDPNVGIQMGQQQYGNEMTMAGYQSQANAAASSARSNMMGGLFDMAGTIGAAAMMCWVAREVYGADNPKWLQFRAWMLNYAPSWFRALYVGYGERFAKLISNKPLLKRIIRKWMDTKIK